MLRKIRIFLAALFFVAITLIFLDFTGTVVGLFGWMATIQFLPALLAANVAVVIVLLLITLAFGRVYCSVICPLGVMQDIISRFSSIRRGKHGRFRYSREKKWLRYGIFALFVISIIVGFNAFTVLLAPYSSYGRMVSGFLAPIYAGINNLLAGISEQMGNYMFYRTEVVSSDIYVLSIAAVTLIVLIILAWRNGRTYCNTICPVGTVLGFFARFAIFRPVIDTSKCTKCGRCSRICKSSCIDFKNRKIDYNRCISCMNCLKACNNNALKYGYAYGRKMHPHEISALNAANKCDKPQTQNTQGTGRRTFLTVGAAFAVGNILHAQTKHGDGGLAVIETKRKPTRDVRVLPPGAISAEHFARHCTACQLCVSQCPDHLLRPSSDLEHFMQPEMSFEKGHCRPECTRCSEVCPTGAIQPITTAEKTAIQIGVATWQKDLCVVNTKHVTCGLCARRCPSEAIVMVPIKDIQGDNGAELAFPAVNFERCIGCGSCEYHCPARPYPAIFVNGIEMHRII